MHSLSQARFLTRILKQTQVRREIEELKLSLIDRISDLQDSIFEEIRRTLRLVHGTSQVVLPRRVNLVLGLRLSRTYTQQPGPHIRSRDSDGVSSLSRN
jgi:hypothetical protein